MTEAFSFLNSISNQPEFQASWIPRLSGVNVDGDREFALRNLAPLHDQIISAQYPSINARHHAEQVHGNGISVISEPLQSGIITHPGTDGLITNVPNQLLAIYVADCAAIYLADSVSKAIGLLHSGRKGTELNILEQAVRKMTEFFGTDPANLTCILSPCIRPPDYEMNLPESVHSQARALGIDQFYDSCENTAADLTAHYSYRVEKGKTGRMLALLTLQ
ncbi:laccase domain-containing protein [Luteolibacter algae]|uniref:Laccase domain-containing protein n=1 Tax=Luteolibacter algae TaxID=454151 RepID=A0ABW5DAD1_9BACT